MKKITKAVIIAAGYGTRFLPETKSVTKEMLPIIDRPILHYIVEEAVKSGIKDIIFVTRGINPSLETYFDADYALEEYLDQNGKQDKLAEIQELSGMANFIFMKQRRDLPYGTGTPLLSVKSIIGKDEPFAYIQGDDLVLGKTPALKTLMDTYYAHPDAAAIVVSQKVPKEEVTKYGIVALKDEKTGLVEKLIEKPSITDAPSNLATYGRYILTYPVIEQIEKKILGKDNELWLADALNVLSKSSQVYNTTVEGKWLTTGDPFNYIKAMLTYALERDDLKDKLLEFIHTL